MFPAYVTCGAPIVILTWDANLEPDIAGYRVYYGTTSRGYSNILDVGLATTNLFPNLTPGTTYYFAVTAYNASALESDLSEEASYTVPPGNTLGVLTTSANPALPGTEVTFTFTVNAVGLPGIPGGLAMLKVDGVPTILPLVDGTAVLSTSTLSPGIHRIEAEYLGDLIFTPFATRLTPDQLINTPPIAGPDYVQRSASNGAKVPISNLLSNDFDADADALTFVSVSGQSANGGNITRSGNWIYYTPPAGFTNDDAFTYMISDGREQPVTGIVTVHSNSDQALFANLIITQSTPGSYRIRFDGIPGLTYRIEYTDSVNPPIWQTLGSGTANEVGVVEIIDTLSAGSTGRFYRSAFP